MDILGEDLVNSIESKSPSPGIASRPLPSVPTDDDALNRNRGMSVDEVPPEVPQRTDARLEMVNFEPLTTASVAAPTYDIPGAVTSTGSETVRGSKLPSPPVIVTTNDDYEEPLPREDCWL